MIVNGMKERKLGEFDWKCKDASCYFQSMETYSQWSNSAKLKIRELKKGATMKLTQSADQYESYDPSHTAHDNYHLDGHVPKMVVSGETNDISLFFECDFWEWDKFLDKVVTFPGNPLVLGEYLGLTIDVGLVMIQCIMKANVKI